MRAELRFLQASLAIEISGYVGGDPLWLAAAFLLESKELVVRRPFIAYWHMDTWLRTLRVPAPGESIHVDFDSTDSELFLAVSHQGDGLAAEVYASLIGVAPDTRAHCRAVFDVSSAALESFRTQLEEISWVYPPIREA